MCRISDSNGLYADSLPHVLVPWVWPQFLHHPDATSADGVPSVCMCSLPNSSDHPLSDASYYHSHAY